MRTNPGGDWHSNPVGSGRKRRASWYAAQQREVSQMRANFSAPPGTFAWAALHGPDLCERIRQRRPDLATWTKEDIQHNRKTR